ncbi:MAG: 50S ribosomal protein L24 [Clostridiales bacterium]|nr:50S ribosomal protein L24 [Clostridiales bacterium]
MKVKKNDNVVVLTGKDKKKTGKVIEVMPKLNKVVVEGVNVQTKSKKARSAQETSQFVKKEGPIDASNVLVICPVCNKATRVAHAEVDGKKVRVCKKCNAPLDGKFEKASKNAVKEEAPKKKATKKKKTENVEETEVKEVKKTSTRKKAVKTEPAEAENA